MALGGLYRTLATQVTGRLKFVSPLCLAASEKVLHTSAVFAAPPDPKPVPLPKLKDSFLDGTSSTYLEELEERYRADPTSVDKSWASFFRSLEQGVAPEAVAEAYHAYEQGSPVSPLQAAAVSNQTIQESQRLLLLVRAYQVNGHFMADLDPLGLDKRPMPIELDPALYGFSDKDLDREFFLGTWNMRGFLSEERPIRTLREVLQRLREAYCGTIGYEYMHIPDRERCNWLRERIETAEEFKYTPERKFQILDRLAWSEMFESFLANKYAAAKRFGLEGCETLIPGMKALIDRATEQGVESIVMGMPHRGRLNVLANVVRKPLRQIFSEFAGVTPDAESGEWSGTGDVKYHLGTSYDRPTTSGKRVHLSLLANPSHLEAVDPVLVGKVRAKQYYSDDRDRTKNLGVLLHGDGSFSGQGVVYETLDMSALPDYTVGGVIHIVVNNQVAFTTDPRKSRSSPYCTDVAKALNAPILHVNGDDVEAVTRACELAAEWRQRWKSDVVVDIVCYRKYGHNEIDEPSFTQPLMYQKVRKMENVFKKYQKKLLEEGNVKEDDLKKLQGHVSSIMSSEFEAARQYKPEAKDWLSSYWAGYNSPSQMSRIRNTGVPLDVLKEVGYAITKIPEDFTMHKGVKRVYEQRRQMIESGEGVDWGTAEALAFGTLLSEGNHVRLSGQDVERGTFSHRHAVVHDQVTGESFTPLSHVFSGQKPGQFTVSNSSLSEFGILGFELGYALENPNSLVLWEAQFGDFANCAQVIFDQFMSSGETKWRRQNGLTVLLPHGYDGQGPEHSSARLERYLQMVDENPYEVPKVDESKWFSGGHLGGQIQKLNWQIANCTTPANYFHLLRRQIHRQFRKPLIVMTPKNLLRTAKSGLWEFDEIPDDKGIQGVRFKRLIMDEAASDRSPHPPKEEGFKRLVFCSGKVYYELAAGREKAGTQNEVAIVRVEQLAPFPFDLVMRELRRYPNAEVMWAQEEPMNMGAYFHVAPRLKTCMSEEGHTVPMQLAYAGRPPCASTATGFGKVHAQEQAALVEAAVQL
ncbi:2-oxoglutarate dehydrogenase, mitochondrial [Coccomyxa sp. Obi]|nr:2-oxoglutarate dehydrogenase, mitochondrial [Coccomyxa sp. Obi]